jgi:hypothetical protein
MWCSRTLFARDTVETAVRCNGPGHRVLVGFVAAFVNLAGAAVFVVT